jgi:hypothetical protein
MAPLVASATAKNASASFRKPAAPCLVGGIARNGTGHGLAPLFPRLLHRQRNRWKADREDQPRQAQIRAPPSDIRDQDLRKLRRQGGSKSDARHGDAERQAAPVVEPGCDGLGIRQRGLASRRDAHQRIERHEDAWRSGGQRE